VSPSRGIGFFRQVPALARAWLPWADVMGMVAANGLAGLFNHYRWEFAWPGNAFCGRCRWRWVCGGTDGWNGVSQSHKGVLETICEHRLKLLEMFAREKIGMMLGSA